MKGKLKLFINFLLILINCNFSAGMWPWLNCNGHDHLCITKYDYVYCDLIDNLYWPNFDPGNGGKCENCYCSDYHQDPCPINVNTTTTTTTKKATTRSTTTTNGTTTTTSTTPSTTTTTPTTTITTPTTTTTTPTTTTTTPTTNITTTTNTTTSTSTTNTTSTTTTPTTTTTYPTTTTNSTSTGTTSTTTETTTSSTTTPTSTSTTTATTTSKTTVSTTPYPYVNKSCCHDGELIPDSTSCRLYFLCTLECGVLVKRHQMCPANWVFDPVNLKCSSDLSSCSIPLPTFIRCTCEDINIPDPFSNEYYYSCRPRVEYSYFYRRAQCPGQYLFNSTSLMCDIHNSQYIPPKSCGSSIFQCPLLQGGCLPVSQAKNPPLYFTDSCPYEGIFSDPNDCNTFYICLKDKHTGHLTKTGSFCDGFNYFDPRTQTCTPDSSKCLCTTDNSYICESAGTFVDPKCPSRFYECILGPKVTYVPEKLACFGNSIFDPIRKICVDKVIIPPIESIESSVISSSMVSSSSEGSKSSSSDKSRSSSSEESRSSSRRKYRKHSSSESSSSGSGSSSTKKRYCPIKGKYPCKDDGGSYYACKDDYIAKQKCPKDKLFDRSHRTCRPKEKVADCTTCHGKSILNNFDFQINNVI